MKDELQIVNEVVNHEGFIVRLNNGEDSNQVQREKKHAIFNSCAKRGKVKGLKHTVGVNFHPYRKLVDVDEEKLESDYNKVLEFYRENSQMVLMGVSQRIKSGYEDKTLDELGVGDKEVYNLTFRNAIDVVFAENNGVLEFEDMVYGKLQIPHELFGKFLDIKKLSNSVTQCRLMLNSVNSNKYLPINDYTKDYIKFDRETALITLKLDKTSGFRSGITEDLMTIFMTSVYENGGEIVDVSQHKFYVSVNILVKNKDVSKLLDCLVDDYKGWDIGAYNNNYNLSVEIETNIGHEDAATEYFYLLNGKHYESLKEQFVLEEEKYLGLDSYK